MSKKRHDRKQRDERKQRSEAELARKEELARQKKWRSRAVIVLVVLTLAVMGVMSVRRGSDESKGRVWSPEHGHWHDK
jgi:hypothetical protein